VIEIKNFCQLDTIYENAIRPYLNLSEFLFARCKIIWMHTPFYARKYQFRIYLQLLENLSEYFPVMSSLKTGLNNLKREFNIFFNIFYNSHINW